MAFAWTIFVRLSVRSMGRASGRYLFPTVWLTVKDALLGAKGCVLIERIWAEAFSNMASWTYQCLRIPYLAYGLSCLFPTALFCSVGASACWVWCIIQPWMSQWGTRKEHPFSTSHSNTQGTFILYVAFKHTGNIHSLRLIQTHREHSFSTPASKTHREHPRPLPPKKLSWFLVNL